MPIISNDIWITREGKEMLIKDMASSHLLATIHFIERNRFMNAAETYSEGMMDATEYYLQWPIQYDTMIAEAQRRKLLHRGVEGLVHVKKGKK